MKTGPKPAVWTPESTKACNECHTTMLATAEFFPPDKRGKYGLAQKCRKCYRPRAAAAQRRWARRRSSLFPGLTNAREACLRQLYGLSPGDYLSWWNVQGGKCAICASAFKSLWFEYVDHCHETNRVCGLLCRLCNAGIGHLREDPEVLMRAAYYCRGKRPRRLKEEVAPAGGVW